MALDRELSDAFQAETRQLLKELVVTVERIKNSGPPHFPKEALAEFAQKIDRVMGTAKTFAGMDPTNQVFVKVGKMAEMCKQIGIRASQKGEMRFLKPVAVIWGDVIKVMDNLVENLYDGNRASVATKQLASILKDRLKWLSEELGLDLR